jgi:GNAT superfamily N-acetyltransferase
VAPFAPEDLAAFTGTGAADLDQAGARMERGDRPWGLWDGDALVAYGWTGTRPIPYRDLFLVEPSADAPYFFDYFTHPDHRGRGCYPALLRGIAAALHAEGARGGWIAVDVVNVASWRGVRKAGFRHAADLVIVRRRLGVVVRRGAEPTAPVRLRARGVLVPAFGRAA